MWDASELKNTIVKDAQCLVEPEDYFKGFGRSGCTVDNILLMRRYPGWPISRRKDYAKELCHSRYVLTINLHTDGIACVNEKQLALPEDSAFLIYPYQTHNYIVNQDDFFWLVFTFESLEAYPAGLMYRVVNLSTESYFLISQLLRVYLSLQDNITDIKNELLNKYLEALLLEMRDATRKVNSKTHGARTVNKELQLFEKINGYILRYLDDPQLSVKTLAAKHYVSVSFMHSLFKNMVNQTPGEYIRFVRLDRAKKLLLHGNTTIAEVAERSGFSSPAVFSRCFHRDIGLTPQKFMLEIKR